MPFLIGCWGCDTLFARQMRNAWRFSRAALNLAKKGDDGSEVQHLRAVSGCGPVAPGLESVGSASIPQVV